LNAREQEIGPTIESVTKQSCEKAPEAEKRCRNTETESEIVSITAWFDMGWQRCEKAHNSLTGDYFD